MFLVQCLAREPGIRRLKYLITYQTRPYHSPPSDPPCGGDSLMISFPVNPHRLVLGGERKPWEKVIGGLDLASWRKSKKGAQATQVDGPPTAQCPASRVSDPDLVCSRLVPLCRRWRTRDHPSRFRSVARAGRHVAHTASSRTRRTSRLR